MSRRFNLRHSKQLKKRNKYRKRKKTTNTNLIACTVVRVTYFIIYSYILIDCLYRLYEWVLYRTWTLLRKNKNTFTSSQFINILTACTRSIFTLVACQIIF